MKTIESRIAPNPMEAQIWVDLSADAHGLVNYDHRPLYEYYVTRL